MDFLSMGLSNLAAIQENNGGDFNNRRQSSSLTQHEQMAFLAANNDAPRNKTHLKLLVEF